MSRVTRSRASTTHGKGGAGRDPCWQWRNGESRPGTRRSNAQASPPFLTYPCRNGSWDPGPWTHTCPSGRNTHQPSWVSVVSGWPCCLTSLDGALAPPALGPGRCAPLQLTKPHSSFIQSSGTYWGWASARCWGELPLSSLWSPLTCQSHLAQGPPQALSPHTGQLPAEHERNCPCYLHVFRAMPSPDRHDVCFAPSYGSGTILPVDRDPPRGPNGPI